MDLAHEFHLRLVPCFEKHHLVEALMTLNFFLMNSSAQEMHKQPIILPPPPVDQLLMLKPGLH